jgi:hypothetical protein
MSRYAQFREELGDADRGVLFGYRDLARAEKGGDVGWVAAEGVCRLGGSSGAVDAVCDIWGLADCASSSRDKAYRKQQIHELSWA